MRIPLLSLIAALLAAPAMAKDPPRTLFISPMGQPFRTDDGAPEAAWFKAADKDGDGRLTLSEFSLDASRFFALLDTDHNGALSPDEIQHYESEIAPEIQSRGFGRGAGGGGFAGGGGMGRGGRRPGGGGGFGGGAGGPPPGGMGGGHRGGMGGGMGAGMGGGGGYAQQVTGAGRYGYIATPEPVTATDTDFNGTVTRAEFLGGAQRRFELLDANGDGSIGQRELPKLKVNPRLAPAIDTRPPPDAGAGGVDI
jgi:hypothetical protein